MSAQLHSAKVIADSVSTAGVRLTTLEVVMPRIVLAEFNTHRMFSRNSASSRAIPVEKMIRAVLETPYVPATWGANQKGMQAGQPVDAATAARCEKEWLSARDYAVNAAQTLLDLGIHKQTTNRLLEPFMWHTVLVTATEWSNFFHRRDHPAAHPDIAQVARLMRAAMDASTPRYTLDDEWHLPYATNGDFKEVFAALKVSTARCARVSYLTHAKEREIEEDSKLHDDLLAAGHMSPFEHPAKPATAHDMALMSGAFVSRNPAQVFYGNFKGWVQYRKMLPNEADMPV